MAGSFFAIHSDFYPKYCGGLFFFFTGKDTETEQKNRSGAMYRYKIVPFSQNKVPALSPLQKKASNGVLFYLFKKETDIFFNLAL